eukprot:gene20349-biopygen5575
MTRMGAWSRLGCQRLSRDSIQQAVLSVRLSLHPWHPTRPIASAPSSVRFDSATMSQAICTQGDSKADADRTRARVAHNRPLYPPSPHVLWTRPGARQARPDPVQPTPMWHVPTHPHCCVMSLEVGAVRARLFAALAHTALGAARGPRPRPALRRHGAHSFGDGGGAPKVLFERKAATRARHASGTRPLTRFSGVWGARLACARRRFSLLSSLRGVECASPGAVCVTRNAAGALSIHSYSP